MKITASEKILDKLKKKHNVTLSEVKQCFENLEGGFLEDDRAEHRTDPPTYWFVAETNQGRLLKVVFIKHVFANEPVVHIRTAYSANQTEIDIYERHGK